VVKFDDQITDAALRDQLLSSPSGESLEPYGANRSLQERRHSRHAKEQCAGDRASSCSSGWSQPLNSARSKQSRSEHSPYDARDCQRTRKSCKKAEVVGLRSGLGNRAVAMDDVFMDY